MLHTYRTLIILEGSQLENCHSIMDNKLEVFATHSVVSGKIMRISVRGRDSI
jgi:hypothetical protein